MGVPSCRTQNTALILSGQCWPQGWAHGRLHVLHLLHLRLHVLHLLLLLELLKRLLEHLLLEKRGSWREL
jgi:hypothetical protein